MKIDNNNNILSKEEIYKVFITGKPAFGKALYGKDLGMLWDLATELAESSNGKLIEKVKQLHQFYFGNHIQYEHTR